MTNEVYISLFLLDGTLFFDNTFFALVFNGGHFQPDFRMVAKMSLKTQNEVFCHS